MNRRALWIGVVLLALTGLLAYGTWCCLDWLARRQVTQASLLSSETWSARLGLTPQQSSKIEPLERGLKQELDRIQAKLAQRQIALCRLMMASTTPDRPLIRRTIGQISALQQRREERVAEHLLALRDALGPEQQRKLFTTLMQDICRGCRTTTGGGKEYCGLCPIR